MKRKAGYYWVRFKDYDPNDPYERDGYDGWTVGYHDGSNSHLPWQIVASDCIFGEEELDVGEEIVRREAK